MLLTILLPLLLSTYTNSITPSSSSITPPQIPTSPRTKDRKLKVVIGIDGGTESIRACCFNAHTGKALSKPCAIPYKTTHPHPGWAEQDPETWYENLIQAVRNCISSLKEEYTNYDICGMCVDTTCCSVVTLDKNYKPLRPCLLWMDVRSSLEANDILKICKSDAALNVNNNGCGPLSAEWLLPKALWIYRNEYDTTWKNCEYLCEYQDYINYRLTGVFCASSCNAAVRWHWNGKQAVKDDDDYPGRPISLYEKLGIKDLLYKLPKKCIPMGTIVGTLTKQSAEELDLRQDIPVAQGGPDAFVGMIGLGCIHPGNICLITGSSHLHCCVMENDDIYSNSAWGAYRGAPLQGISFMEGGQSSTGSIVKWTKDVLFGGAMDYKELDDEAMGIAPGSDGLIVLETFQGSRTPSTDPRARGAILGMTLSHTKAHIWRSILEGICLGTRSCIEGLTQAAIQSKNYNFDTITIAGGTINSKFWLQLQADILGKTLIINENCNNAPLLGCAILASVGAGVYDTVQDAVAHMVREESRVQPNMIVHDTYTKLYQSVYKKLLPTVQPIFHTLSSLRGGDTTKITISPSILSSDWSNLQNEIQKILKNNLTRIHVDIFDGVFIPSPHAFTFGPTMISHLSNYIQKERNDVQLDVHLCVVNPKRYIDILVESGATCIIFQWEAVKDDAIQLAQEIKSYNIECGVSLNPETDINDNILSLLQSGYIDVINILAVNAGFGGQTFQKDILQKFKVLQGLRYERNITIMIDGGINSTTTALCLEHVIENESVDGVVLVSGSYLFGCEEGFDCGVERMRDCILEYYDS